MKSTRCERPIPICLCRPELVVGIPLHSQPHERRPGHLVGLERHHRWARRGTSCRHRTAQDQRQHPHQRQRRPPAARRTQPVSPRHPRSLDASASRVRLATLRELASSDTATAVAEKQVSRSAAGRPARRHNRGCGAGRRSVRSILRVLAGSSEVASTRGVTTASTPRCRIRRTAVAPPPRSQADRPPHASSDSGRPAGSMSAAVAQPNLNRECRHA